MTLSYAAAAAQNQDGGQSTTNPASKPVRQDQFLQLLVAQIHYQDPTNPTDSTAFVTQLAQFSSLEQLVAIRADLENQPAAGGTQENAQGGK